MADWTGAFGGQQLTVALGMGQDACSPPGLGCSWGDRRCACLCSYLAPSSRPSLRADFLPLVPCSFVGPSSLPLADEAYLTRHEAKEKEERTRYEAVLGAWLADSLRAVCSAAQMTGPLLLKWLPV